MATDHIDEIASLIHAGRWQLIAADAAFHRP
jgi:hypothetical protein